jgi:hypothetical protein
MALARMGEKRNACRISVGTPEGKRPLQRSRRRWADNTKMYLREIGWGGIDWIDLAQDRDQWRALVKTVMYFGFHKMLGSSWVAERLAASQEGLSSMKLVNPVSYHNVVSQMKTLKHVSVIVIEYFVCELYVRMNLNVILISQNLYVEIL